MRFNLECIEKIHNPSINLPNYDIQSVKEETKKNPIWIHFGVGNIFRGYIARLQEDLLNNDQSIKGIIACETFDYEIIEKIYKPYDNLTMLATLAANKEPKYQVIASVCDAINIKDDNEFNILKNHFKNKSLQMVSLTITEKGYSLQNMNNDYLPIVLEDFTNGPKNCNHAMSILCSLLLERYNNGKYPIALVSMDNCSHNGEKLEKAIQTVANKWLENNFVDNDFISYISDSKNVSYPWSMIDKITPRPDINIAKNIEAFGFEMETIVTSKGTYIAPFVNAEVSEYLVIEDNFPNGRPKLEKAGVYFTTREIVNKVEKMKVTTCLNPLHTALAVFGCLLGYNSIASEMMSPELVKLVKGIAEEGMKVVINPGIISPEAFVKEVIWERLPNKAIPDTPQRIATDTSQKIPVRYGETIKAYLASHTLNINDLKYIPLAIAGWLRYTLGVDDKGKPFTLSNDPMLDDIKEILKDIKVGKPSTYNGQVRSILSNKKIFQINLMETPLGPKIEEMFISMIKGSKAVINTLKS